MFAYSCCITSSHYMQSSHIHNVSWKNLKFIQPYGNRALLAVRNYASRAIPVFIHGDGVPVTGVGKSWGKSCNIYNWGSLLATGKTVEIVFWIYSCFSDLYAAGKTSARIFKILKWSFTALWEGRHPHADWRGCDYPADSEEAKLAGTPLVGDDLTNSLFCVIWKLKGDLDWHFKDLV